MSGVLWAAGLLMAAGIASAAQSYPSVRGGVGQKLIYTTDERGNRVVDFSHAGYRGRGVPIPDVPARIYVPPAGKQDRDRIQAAINLVSQMAPDANGFRGAILLGRGTYRIDSSLHIGASGVVLRGAGSGEDGTVLVATGTSRRALITILGSGQRAEVRDTRRTVADDYVPVGAMEFTVADGSRFHPGDSVVIERPSTAEWIAFLGMNLFQGWRAPERLHWLPGSRNITWDRTITAVDGNRLRIDAPLTTALDRAFGGASIYRYEFPGRIRDVGVENLRLVSAYDPGRPKDEDHSWFAISLDKVENAWVRQVTALHFVSYVINAEAGTKRLTVEDCDARDPVGEDASYRGRLYFIAGQLTLFQRCRGRRGRQDFSVGFTAAGPNVFLDSVTEESTNYSGPLESWASGVLFDNVVIRGNAIRFINRGTDDQGAGWAAANSIVWNSEATDIEVESPPGAYNQAYGCKGDLPWQRMAAADAPYSDFHRGAPEQPRSLYLQQLAERLGPNAVENLARRRINASSEDVRELSAAELAAFVRAETSRLAVPLKPLRLERGHFTIDGRPAWTGRTGFQFYLAQMPPSLAAKFGPAITRFAPGRTGLGLTDDMEEVAAAMPPGSAFYHNYGLWYDRRRVNHNFDGSAERRTGDVWAPFIELPWARSGQGKAWDGLSKFDLTRFNPWFFERVKQFADLCDRRGLILYHAFYFQHWLLETPAHYVDFPWRPANTIQNTDMPDQNPAASTFYDVSNPVRRELHRQYIRHCLDVLRDNTNVVYGIDREYTGPAEFVHFWLDIIAEWEKENGKRVFIALEIPKPVLDEVLADPVYRPMISAIGIHGWNYQPDGSLFAIQGGVNLAPRQQETGILTEADWIDLRSRIKDPAYLGAGITYANETVQLVRKLRTATPALRYRAIREYRDRFPDLAVIGQPDEFAALSDAVEEQVPAALRSQMRPAPLVLDPRDTAWCMATPGSSYLVYSMEGQAVSLDLSNDRNHYAVRWIDPSAKGVGASAGVGGGATVRLAPPAAGRPWVAWLTRAAAVSPRQD